MRTSFHIAALTAFGTCIFASPACAEDLTGKMTPFSYLLNKSWSCSTNVPAMGGQPAHTDKVMAAFDMAPGNVVHNHIQSANFEADYYFGYSDRIGSYWQTSADNLGGHSYLTSADGTTYTGTASMGTTAMQETATFAKVSPNKVTIHEVLSGGPMAGTFDSTCDGTEMPGV